MRAPGFAVPVVDTNGAGDVFHGACAVGELREWPFEWTLTFANAVAAMKCRTLGGRKGIPRLGEVATFLAERGHRELAADALARRAARRREAPAGAASLGRGPRGAERPTAYFLLASKISPKSTQRSPSNFASCSCSIG